MIKRLLFLAVALTLITTGFALAPQVKIAGLAADVTSAAVKAPERTAENTAKAGSSLECADPGASKPSFKRAGLSEFLDFKLTDAPAAEGLGETIGTAVEGTAPAKARSMATAAATGTPQIVTGTLLSRDMNYKGVRYGFRMSLEETATEGVYDLINVYGLGDTVSMSIDAATGAVAIPRQKIYQHSTYGEVSIVPLTLSESGGFVLPSGDLEGTIDAEGTISLGMWGVCVTQRDTVDGEVVPGEYFGRLFNVFDSSKFSVPNTVVTCNSIADNKIVMYEAYMDQTQPNEVIFYGLGKLGSGSSDVLTARVTADKRILVSPQTMYTNMMLGPFLNYPAEFTLDAATNQYKVKVDTKTPMAFTCDGEGSYSIPGWVIAAKASPSAYIGYAYSDVTLATELAMTYPERKQLAMSGSGTEADPYIVTSTDDIEAISQACEGGESFAGTWFRMGADIDFSSVSATGYQPIGSTATPFEGVFDGSSRTISNFKADGKGFYSTGLFGAIGANGTVENITFDKAFVTASGYNMGIAAATSAGTIRGITVNSSGVDCNGELGGGIVGEVTGGSVSNCSFTGSITTVGSGAGIAAEAMNAAISDCHVRANITIDGAQSSYSNKEGAGIAGTILRTSITRCSMTGTLTDALGYSHLGGIAGYAGQSTITECFNIAPLSAKRAVQGSMQSPKDGETYTGGIVGYTSGTDITDCYNSGLILKSDRSDCVGGIAGYLAVGYSFSSDRPAEMINISHITNCYNSGQIISTSEAKHKGIYGDTFISTSYSGLTPEEACLKDTYFDSQVAGFEHPLYGKTTRELTSALPASFDSSVWTFAAGSYPVLANTGAGSQAREISAMPLTLRANDNTTKVKEYFEVAPAEHTTWALAFDAEAGETATETASLRMEGSKVIVKDKYDNAVVNATTADGWSLKMYRLALVPKLYDGEGTADDPYQLKTAKDWKNLHEAVALYSQMHRGDHFAMMNDIDFAADTVEFRGVGYGSAFEFAGQLDGRGHSVHGLKIDAGVYDEAGTATTKSLIYNGLFGIINEDGAVRNVTIAPDNDFMFYAYGGPIAGLSQGVIENCRNYATVNAINSNCGGIVGVNYDGGSVIGCYNAGAVRYGVSNAGGITGYNRQTASIDLCQNDGDVVNTVVNAVSAKTKSNTAGGIAGNNYGSIDRSVNNGHVRAYNTVGGIVGNNNGFYAGGDVNRSVNNGYVYCIDEDLKRGGIIGYLNGRGKIAGNFYDASVNVNGAANNNGTEGVTGLSSSELVAGTALDGLTADDFDFRAGGYPVLKKFADEEASQALRSIYVAFAPKVMRTNVLQDTPLSTAEGITFTLVEANDTVPGAFSIDGSMLKVTKPEGLKVSTDSLTASLGDKYLKSFRINAIPEILKGAGLADDPYLIETPADWNKLAQFMEESKWEYSGNFFRLANDIDFAGDSIKVVAVNGVNFQGTLDGDGHTMRNYVYSNTNTSIRALKGPNLYLGRYLGVIGTLGSTGTFRNIILDGSIEGASYIASAVGDNYGVIENVVNRGKVYTTSNYANGIAARAYDGSVIRGCTNSGTIQSKSTYVSGIVYETKAGALLDNCLNDGELTAGTSNVAGIVYNHLGGARGCVNSSKMSGTGTMCGIAYTVGKTAWLDSCVNNSDIDILNIAKPGTGVYGIASTLTARTAAEIGNGGGFVRDCHNHGKLTGKSNIIGGLGTINAGWAISDCSNTGDISTDPTATSAAAYGFSSKITGGKTKGSETIDLMSTMERCFNSGNVSGAYGKLSGLVGESAKYTYIADCYNTGNIVNRSASMCCAGISSQHNGVMERCFNTGDLECWGNAVGGLVGYMASGELDYPAKMLNCFNTGNVTTHYEGTNTNGNAGGLGGYLSTVKPEAPHEVKNCYNSGNVTANQRVAGLFAGAFRPQSVVEDCYNFGKITCVKPDSQGRYYWSGTTFTNNYTYVSNGDTLLMLSGHRNCYYDKTINPTGQFRNTPGSAKTTAQLRELLANSDFAASDFGGYPTLGIFADKDATAVGSAMILLSNADDTFDKVTGEITLVGPAGAEWTSCDFENDSTTTGYAEAFRGDGNLASTRVSIEGDRATLTAAGKAVISCRYNGLKKDFVIDIDQSAVTAIDEVFAGKEVKATEIYDLEGRRVNHTQAGSIYIVRTIYTDGTMKVEKKVARD